MKIVFMGTPDFSVNALENIVKAGHDVVGVITQPDKPKGRGGKMQYTPVKEKALELGLDVYQPQRVKETEFIEKLKEMNPDAIVVIAFGQILPKAILDMPKYGCINVHASLLPKYRGAAPIQWSVIDGEKETGVTTMYMSAGMDTGDMILKREVTIGDNETTGELWDRLSKIGGELLVETVKKIENGEAPRIKQGDDFTMAPMLNKEMSKIDWENKTAIEIKNLVRGLNPIMGAYSFYDGKKIKFWKVQAYSDEQILQMFPELEEYKDRFLDLPEGTILFSDSKIGLYIKAKEGNIKVLEIQGENAKKMKTEDFLRGTYLAAGLCFE